MAAGPRNLAFLTLAGAYWVVLLVQGLVLPPRLASTQVVVIPIPNAKMQADARAEMVAQAGKLADSLREAGLRVALDARDNQTPGWKYSHWELKVIPACLLQRCQG